VIISKFNYLINILKLFLICGLKHYFNWCGSTREIFN